MILTAAVYSYAFYDIARADQLIYLYSSSHIHGLWNLTVRAYDFNRTNSVGDFVLFRPVLYMTLGLERRLWGYNFAEWQATSIGLPILVVLSLFIYFLRECQRLLPNGRSSVVPFILALYFAFLYAGTEMVAWHHIVGYLLFCPLAVHGVLAYQRLLEKRSAGNAPWLVSVTGLACFTYELGNLMSGLMVAGLVTTIVTERSRFSRNRNDILSHHIFVATAFALICLPVLYVNCSYLDYVTKIGPIHYRRGSISVGHAFLAFIASAALWLIGSLDPASFQLMPGPRIEVAAHPFVFAGIWSFVGGGLVVLLVVSVILLSRNTGFSLDLLRDLIPGIAASLMALGFTGVIVTGRSMDPGIASTLLLNSYYAYIFMLFCVIAFFHLLVAPSLKTTGAHVAAELGLFVSALAVITLFGGIRIYSTQRAMFQTYSGPVNRVIRSIETLQNEKGKERDFSFSLAPDCPCIADLSWFARYSSEKRKRYTIASALFPKGERSHDGKYVVDWPGEHDCAPFGNQTRINQSEKN